MSAHFPRLATLLVLSGAGGCGADPQQHEITAPGELLTDDGRLREPGWSPRQLLHWNGARVHDPSQLRQWDFFHCPPGVEHIFVGEGKTPCVLLMVGSRPEGKTLHYPRNETALRHGAGVEESTPSPHEAYAPHPHWRPGRPEAWDTLPWVRSPG